jgi:hypothetical protein
VPTHRRSLSLAASFAVGILVGSCLVAILSSRASRQFLLVARLSLQVEEDREAAEAWSRGDFGAALGHAACSTSARYGSGAKAFAPDRTNWPVYFPFVAPILRRIMEPNLTPRGEAHAEAAERAKLGIIWEQLGQAALAEREYQAAAKLSGANDTKRMRDIGRELLEVRPGLPTTGK